MSNRFCNNEAMITFLGKDRGRRTTMVANQTLNNIKNGIIHGLEYCVRRQRDCDMFVVLQGNKAIPNARSIPLHGIDGNMVACSDGSLKFVTREGHYCLHVMFIGGGSCWVLADDESDDSLEVEGLTQMML